MKERRAAFRQVDVTRALRAAKAAGLTVSGYAIDATGKIIINTASGEQREVSPLDEWIDKHAQRAS